jgi:N,N-dimethylglycine/sarcosine catabolism electron transfer flavoprotein subunit beta
VVLDIAVLLSIGRHPASGRGCRADGDARALEMALRLGPVVLLHAIHAGDPAEPALADYLGMGIESLTVLRQPAGADVLPALFEHLARLKPALILAGSAAEQGEGSGMLPYLLARRLGANLLPAIADIDLGEERIEILQALPRGRRRKLSAPLPCLVTVDRAAAAPRQSAFAKARHGRILALELPAGPPEGAEAREIPARPKPKRLKIVTGTNAAERLRAATQMQAGRGKLLVDPPAEEAARAIYDYLQEEGILSPVRLVDMRGSD